MQTSFSLNNQLPRRDLYTRSDLLNHLSNVHGRPVADLRDLAFAIHEFESYIKSDVDSHFNMDKDLLTFIYNSACGSFTKEDFYLQRMTNSQVSFTAAQVLMILANAFLLNLPRHPNVHAFGNVSLACCYFDCFGRPSINKIKCLFSYFYLSMKGRIPESDVITVQRLCFEKGKMPSDMSSIPVCHDPDTVFVSVENMESGNGESIVDFANKRVHVHRILPSFTQEEILFSMLPQCYVSILLLEMLEDNEVAVIRGARRCSSYSGFMRSFSYQGIIEKCKTQNVLVMDASYDDHFSRQKCERDILKAMHAFSLVNGRIATGNWGCGEFGGHKSHKFLQQLLAFSLRYHNATPDEKSELQFYFSVFNDHPQVGKYMAWLRKMKERSFTAQNLFDLIISYRGQKDFDDHVHEYLK